MSKKSNKSWWWPIIAEHISRRRKLDGKSPRVDSEGFIYSSIDYNTYLGKFYECGRKNYYYENTEMVGTKLNYLDKNEIIKEALTVLDEQDKIKFMAFILGRHD